MQTNALSEHMLEESALSFIIVYLKCILSIMILFPKN